MANSDLLDQTKILLDQILDQQATQVVEFYKYCQQISLPQNFHKPVGLVVVACPLAQQEIYLPSASASANFAD